MNQTKQSPLIRRFAALVCAVIAATTTAAAGNHALTFSAHGIQLDDSTITVHIGDGDMGVDRNELVRWVRRGAEAIVTYYGRFPVEELDVYVVADSGGAVNGGTAYGGHEIVMRVGPETRVEHLDDDWRMTHEMVHVSFPDMDRRHIWMTEGVATYVESIARARAGQMPTETVWKWMVTGLPKGLPEAGDRGLDRTHTWGRTYWGGALYFFLADMTIRRETGNAFSLDDALRAILEAGGDGNAHWPIARIVAAGDAATGTTVMSDLYRDMARKPVTPDLEDWFRRLGVRHEKDNVAFDSRAPLADLRRAVTSPDRSYSPATFLNALRSEGIACFHGGN